MATAGDFEWDDAKAEANEAKHGVSFEEALTVFRVDAIVAEIEDALDPSRLITVGFSAAANLLLVVSTERGVRVRIISARRATKAEARHFGA